MNFKEIIFLSFLKTKDLFSKIDAKEVKKLLMRQGWATPAFVPEDCLFEYDLEVLCNLVCENKEEKWKVDTTKLREEYQSVKRRCRELFWPNEIRVYDEMLESMSKMSEFCHRKISEAVKLEDLDEVATTTTALTQSLKACHAMSKDVALLREKCVKALTGSIDTKGTSISKSAFEDGV